MWKQYFKVIRIMPGRVIVHGYGIIDFSSDDLPLELVKDLYENDCRYLQITEEGKRVLYNIMPLTKKRPDPLTHKTVLQNSEKAKVGNNTEEFTESKAETKISKTQPRKKKSRKKTVRPED